MCASGNSAMTVSTSLSPKLPQKTETEFFGDKKKQTQNILK